MKRIGRSTAKSRKLSGMSVSATPSMIKSDLKASFCKGRKPAGKRLKSK